MDNILEFDLNEIVSKEINDKIKSFEKQLKLMSNELYESNKQLGVANKIIKESGTVIGLLDNLRAKFESIESGVSDDGGWYDSRQKNQFLFIEKILLNLFGIKKEQNGWLSHRGDGTLKAHLAVNYYHSKQTVIDLLKVIKKDSGGDINFINDFIMPFDYSKQKVIDYVKSPKYNTNGCIFGISNFWIEEGAGKSNMPHDLIMKNEFILEDDVFELLTNSINKRVSEYHYLFGIATYNKNISDAQIAQLGECLITMPVDQLKYTETKSFIEKNLSKFNSKTLDYFYLNMTANNQFNTLHWEKFPVVYQHKYLMDKPIEKILKLITDYSCKWTNEEKESFIKEWSKNN